MNKIPEEKARELLTKILRRLRLLGIITCLAYMIVIIFLWMYANHQGYVYFSAGEPILIIKYIEWILGIIGIFTLGDIYKKEIEVDCFVRSRISNDCRINIYNKRNT